MQNEAGGLVEVHDPVLRSLHRMKPESPWGGSEIQGWRETGPVLIVGELFLVVGEQREDKPFGGSWRQYMLALRDSGKFFKAPVSFFQ